MLRVEISQRRWAAPASETRKRLPPSRWRPSRLMMLIGVVLSALLAHASPATDADLDAMKARLSSTRPGDKPHLCVQIAQKQLAEADKHYTASEMEQAQTALTEVVAYSELARDYSVQSNKAQKQTEIAVRSMARKLTAILHSLGHDEQAPVKDAIDRLERVRSDLLMSMFKKGSK